MVNEKRHDLMMLLATSLASNDGMYHGVAFWQ
jgi:hypothetical protein